MGVAPADLQGPELRAYFRWWIATVEWPLAAFQEQADSDGRLLVEHLEGLDSRVGGLRDRIERALDGEQWSPDQRRGLFDLTLAPASPEPLDDADNDILDRLIGHALRTDNIEDLAYYHQAMVAGPQTADDERVAAMGDVLAALAARRAATEGA